MEAYEGYWRKVPHVKLLVFRSVPEFTTRMAMLKRGEADVAYLLDVPQAQERNETRISRWLFRAGSRSSSWIFWTSGTRSLYGRTASVVIGEIVPSCRRLLDSAPAILVTRCPCGGSGSR